jgi:hypothetical protein
MSSADTRLSTGSIVSLLKATGGTGGPVAGSINVNEALTQLNLEQHRGRVAARDAH